MAKEYLKRKSITRPYADQILSKQKTTSSFLKMDSLPLFCESDAIKLCSSKEALSMMKKKRSLPTLPSKPVTDSNLQTNHKNDTQRNSLPSNLKFSSNHSHDLPVIFPPKCASTSKVKFKDMKPLTKPPKLFSNLKDLRGKDSVRQTRSSPRHRKVPGKEENNLAKAGCDSYLSTNGTNNSSTYSTETSQMSLKNPQKSQVEKESKLAANNQRIISQTESSNSRNKRKRKTRTDGNSSSNKKVANPQIHDFPEEKSKQNNNNITCTPKSEHSSERKKGHNRTEKRSMKDSDSIQRHSNNFEDSSESKKSKKCSKRKQKVKNSSISSNTVISQMKLPELNYPKRLRLKSDLSTEHSVSNLIDGNIKPHSFNQSTVSTLTKDLDTSDISSKMETSDISSSRMSKSSVTSLSKSESDNSNDSPLDQSEIKHLDEYDSDDSSNLGSRLGSSHFDSNLHEDSCGESDDDLPDFTFPSNDILYSPKANDYVWVKWKRYPFWPSKIVAVEKNKVQVTFFGGKENSFTVPYKNGNVVPFSSSKAAEFIENGRKHKLKEKFNEGYKEITNEMMDKYLQNDPPTVENHTTLENQFADSFYSLTNGYDEDSFKVDGVNTTPVMSKKSKSKNFSLDVKITPKMKEKYAQQIERLKEKNIKLIEFIKTDQVKEYLEGIYHGTIQSELHDKYTGSAQGKREVEEISLEFLEESQVDEVVGVLVKWYEKLTGNALARIGYIINVWLHEAVVYSLIKVKRYARKKAWQIYTTPRKPTRIAEIIQHQQMLTSTDSLETRLARLRPPPKMMLK